MYCLAVVGGSLPLLPDVDHRLRSTVSCWHYQLAVVMYVFKLHNISSYQVYVCSLLYSPEKWTALHSCTVRQKMYSTLATAVLLCKGLLFVTYTVSQKTCHCGFRNFFASQCINLYMLHKTIFCWILNSIVLCVCKALIQSVPGEER